MDFWRSVREFLGTQQRYEEYQRSIASTGADNKKVSTHHKIHRLNGDDDNNHIHEGVTTTSTVGETKWDTVQSSQEWARVKGTYDPKWDSNRGEHRDRGREDR